MARQSRERCKITSCWVIAMINTSVTEFSKEMTDMYAAFGRNAPDPQVVGVWYSRLQPYSFNDVKQAFFTATATGSQNAHPPSLPQLIASMPAGIMKIDEGYLMAQLHHTTSTVGALFRSEIGTHNINLIGEPKIDSLIRGKLTAFMARLPDMQNEIINGRGFSRSQMRVLLADKYKKLNMCEFAGFRISDESIKLNRDRARLIVDSGLMLEHAAPPEIDKKAVPAPEVSKFINGILSGIDTPAPAGNASAIEPCKKCGHRFESILNICPQCQAERNPK